MPKDHGMLPMSRCRACNLKKAPIHLLKYDCYSQQPNSITSFGALSFLLYLAFGINTALCREQGAVLRMGSVEPSIALTQLDASAARLAFSNLREEGVVDLIDFDELKKGCDGAHDMQPALAAAENYLASMYGGGIVRLPRGVCQIGRSYVVIKSNINLQGSGRGATLIEPTFSAGDIISFGDSSSVSRRQSITGLSILCPTFHTSGAAVHVAGASDTIIRDVQVGDPTLNNSGCYNAFAIDNYGNQAATKITDSTVVNGFGDGISIGDAAWTSAPSEIFISNLTVSKYRNGFSVFQTGGLYGNAISIYQSSNVGCAFAPKSGQSIFAVFIRGLICDSSREDNIYFGGLGSISEVSLINPWASSAGGNGISFNGTNAMDGITLTDAQVVYNHSHGLVVQNVAMTNFQIQGGLYCFNSTAGMAAYDGIAVGTANSGFQITDVISGKCGYFAVQGKGEYSNNQAYGIAISKSAQNFIVSNNRLPGNHKGPIFGPSASKTQIIKDNLSN